MAVPRYSYFVLAVLLLVYIMNQVRTLRSRSGCARLTLPCRAHSVAPLPVQLPVVRGHPGVLHA